MAAMDLFIGLLYSYITAHENLERSLYCKIFDIQAYHTFPRGT